MRNLSAFFVVLGLFWSPFVLAKSQLVFLINTTEFDRGGGHTTNELDEYYDIQHWQKIFPNAQIVRIRSATNDGVELDLKTWMRPEMGEEKEIVGLAIASHGDQMVLVNEPETFSLPLPYGLTVTFASLRGHFAKGARIVFNGCSVLSSMDVVSAHLALASILDALDVKDGSVYANKTIGMQTSRLIQNGNVLEPTLSAEVRATLIYAYLTWPISMPLLYLGEYAFNRGYKLTRTQNQERIEKITYLQAISP
jgi:hypothetical protein